ncbi:MAG: DUF2723 domain-containing protein [Chloroflexi bacterium]|nr:DUF2723 domain-containing protein [Chloroflexota bacterium]
MQTGGRPIFWRTEALIATVVTACVLLVYASQVAPTLTWRNAGADGGDLAAAVATLGIPHPTGYPTYVLVGRLFTVLLPWGDIAYRLNLMSATFAAAAAGALYLAARLLQCLISTQDSGSPSTGLPQAKPRDSGQALWTRQGVAATGSLAYAFAPVPWSQATITEVYALLAFFAAALLVCTLGWLRALESSPSGWKATRWLAAGALVTGLGMGNHLTLGFVVAPGILLALALRRNLRGSGLALVALLAGISVYAYIPWRASADPPVNWGHATDWSGFLWLITGAAYRPYAFGLPAALLPERLASYAGYLVQQFNPAGFALAVLGAARLWALSRTLSLATLWVFLLISVFSVLYNTGDSYIYLLLAFLVMALWLVVGMQYLIEEALAPRMVVRRSLAKVSVAMALAAGLAIFPGVSLVRHYASQDLRNDTSAIDYARQVAATAQPDALIVAQSERHVFSLWYYQYALAPTWSATVLSAELMQYDWYVAETRRRFPGLAAPTEPDNAARLRRLIDAALPIRPVYLTDPNKDILNAFLAEQQGPLYRITGPRPAQ